MDEFPSLLARDFAFKPQGKSAPMAPSRANNSSFVLGSNASEFSKSSSQRSTAVFDDHDRDGPFFNDVFVGPPRYSSTSAVDSLSGNASSFDYGSFSGSSNANSMPVYDKPVYDDDVDIFKGLPGLRTSSTPAAEASSSGAKFDDVFASFSRSSPKHESARESSPLDALFVNLGKKETESRVKSEKDVSAFDDLLPGFGRSGSPSSNRSTSQSSQTQKPPSNSTKTASSVMEDPFGVSGSTSTLVGSSSEVFTDRLEEIGKIGGSGSAKVNGSSVSGGVFDDLDSLNILGKSVPPVSPEVNKRGNDRSLRSKSTSGTQTHPRKESIDRSSVENFDGYAQNNIPVDNFQGSSDTLFDMPSVATDSSRSAGRATSPPSYMSATGSLRSAGRATSPPSYMSATDSLRSAGRATSPPSYVSATDSLRSAGRATSPPSYVSATDSLRSAGKATSPPSYVSATDSLRSAGRATSPPSHTSASPTETNSQVNTTPKSEDLFESAEDVWLTVSEIPLFTQPTSAPPPSRPPPPRPTRVSKLETGNARKKANEYSSFSNSPQCTHSPKSTRAGTRSSAASQIDELEDFAMGRSWNNVNEYGEVPSAEDVESSIAAASAAAMKEAMDRAEAKFRHAKEMRERESFKAARSRESVQPEREERAAQQDAQERLDREMQQKEKEEEQRRLEREREEKEREKKRIEKEKERAREIEKEREKARQAVERATREARERAAAEARLKAERAAVDKANAAARERAERAAVQRAQAEARERAAAEARERAERAAAEARERANAEAREKEARERVSVARAEAEARQRAERAAVERAASEARERAAAEAREKAAAAARANQNQQKNDNDIESFFSMSSRPSSAPRPRANTSDSLFDTQSKGGPEPARRTSVGASSNMRKASSTTNIVDDLSSIFGAAGSSAGEFQEVEGETEERRRARLERHQRTQERAAKALAEKNERDLQAQRDQAERHRIAETLDVEIKRWAAGKEGNIRALLATLQYVLWPESGWQPVSLTDLITAAAVKKNYRKATLCIHPDKVQQKGANLQQKYIAEKVFDMLKEAWNKFNSEELF